MGSRANLQKGPKGRKGRKGRQGRVAVGVVAGLVVALVGAAAGVWYFVIRTPTTKINLAAALQIFKGDRAGGAGGGLPPPGVYRYSTSGDEHLSLAGISRVFPSSSDMVVTDSGRCATMKWWPLVQHMEGIVLCRRANGSRTISSTPSYEDIAGISSTSVIRCPPATYLVPPDPKIGEVWRDTCHSSASPPQPVVFTGRVLGIAGVAVGGHEVPALHVGLTLSFSGSETGKNPNSYWISLDDGLILRQREMVAVSQSAGPLGSVLYSEKMRITLRSLVPTR